MKEGKLYYISKRKLEEGKTIKLKKEIKDSIIKGEQILNFYIADKLLYKFKIKKILAQGEKEISVILGFKEKVDFKEKENFKEIDFDYLLDGVIKSPKRDYLKRDLVVDYLLQGKLVIKDSLYFIKIIKEIKTNTVYRGQNNASWSLLPSIHRNRTNNIKETEFYKKIIEQNLDEFKKQEDFFNEIIKMQHYGIPTPLIDWSYNPLIALYFATCWNKDSEQNDGKVFFSSENDMISFNDEKKEEVNNYLKEIYGRESLNLKQINFFETIASKTMFYNCINENKRISAQRGLFSLDMKPYLFFNNKLKEKYKSKLKDRLKLFDNSLLELKEKLIEEIDIENIKIKEEFKGNLKEICEQIIEERKRYEKLESDENKILSSDKKELIKRIVEISPISLEQDVKTKEIIVLSSAKKRIQEELERYFGINTSTVYPDFIGFVNYLKENF